MKNHRKLTPEEPVCTILFMIVAEFESIQLYEQTTGSIDDDLVQEVLIDMTNEEKEQAEGVFLVAV